MADDGTDKPLIDTERNAALYKDFTERTQRIIASFMERQSSGQSYSVADPVEISKLFLDASAKMMADPAKFADAQAGLMKSYADLWQATAKRLAGEETAL